MSRTTEHKEGKATVRIIYRTAKALVDGSHPFWVRITKDRKSTFVATGHSLLPKYWNDNYTNYREAIRKSYPEPHRNNLINALEGWEKKYSHAADTLAVSDERHDTKAVANKAIEERKQARRVMLLAYIDELVEGMVVARKKGNSIIYRDLRNQLSDFIADQPDKNVDISFSDVSVRFCNQLETFFRQRGNTDTTISNRYRTLRAVFNKAIAEGIAKPEHYPFARNVVEKHKFSIGKYDTSTQKRAISRDEIRKIEAFQPVGTYTGPHSSLRNAVEAERLSLAKNVFLFSFFSAGMNFVDLAKLLWKNITTDGNGNYRLNYVRQKTGGKFSLRLLPAAIAIIDNYRPVTNDGPNSYIFPVLSDKKHVTPTQIHNRIHKVSAMVNEDLKRVGERAGIATPLTTYVARHSFATSLRMSGVADAITSQALGHKTAAVTAVYLDSFASETIDAAFDALL
ncbi:site-specific integrase [Spirosoma sp. KNUC1025]|uniref:site-specific integrase n=1 Tax=Spirosoma sp. KNUC1025 TaxID=2894082 RepID=UPI003864F076|nr:site-specific integrase [Spirosoma sp. KNUC1025]